MALASSLSLHVNSFSEKPILAFQLFVFDYQSVQICIANHKTFICKMDT